MQFDLNLNANSAQRIEVVGQFIKYKSGLGPIRVTTSNGDYIDMTPGQAVYGVPFTGLSVADRSGAANPGVLLAGAFDFRDDTITGSVAMIDPYVGVLNDKNSFMGFTIGGATAGVVNSSGIYNPVGSGKNVVVEAVSYWLSGNPGALYVYIGKTSVPSGLQAQSANKLSGASVGPVARMFCETGGNYGLNGFPIATINSANGDTKVWPLKRPIVLPPGAWLAFNPLTNGQQVALNIEFIEVPV
jgi:hypothetical protein